MHRRYQGFFLWQVWPPGPGRCAGWALSDLGPEMESLMICRRKRRWYISQVGLGFKANEDGDGYLPVVPDQKRYPLAYRLSQRHYRSRREALLAIATEVSHQPELPAGSSGISQLLG